MAKLARLNQDNSNALAQLKRDLTQSILTTFLQRCEQAAIDAAPDSTGATRNSINSAIVAPGVGYLFAGGNSRTDEGQSVFVDYVANLEFNHPTNAGFLRNAPSQAARSMRF